MSHKINVEAQREDKYSFLSLYRRMISLRQQELSLMVGNYTPVYSDNQIIAFVRELEGHHRFLIVLNLSHRPCYYKPHDLELEGVVEVATYPELEGTYVKGTIILGGDEGIVVRIK